MVAGIEAHLGAAVGRDTGAAEQLLLVGQGTTDDLVGQECMPVGVCGDADGAESMVGVEQVAEELDGPPILARLLGVAADDEDPIDAGGPEPRGQLHRVCPVPDHPSGDVRDGGMAAGLQLLGETLCLGDALGRRTGHRDLTAVGQMLDGTVEALHRDDLERQPVDEAQPVRSGGVGFGAVDLLAEDAHDRSLRPQLSPTISPLSSMSIPMAAGILPRPGMVRMSPHRG